MKLPLEKEMYDNVYSALRRRYPASDNWEITPQENRKTYIPDFVVQRDTSKGIEKIVVEVKRDKTISFENINQLNAYTRNLAGNGVKSVNKTFAVFAGTDTSLLTDDFEVIYLRFYKH